jgi:multidrug resistance efflux pump
LHTQSKADSGESRNKEYVEKMARYQLQADTAQAAKAEAEAEEREQQEAQQKLTAELDAAKSQMGVLQNRWGRRMMLGHGNVL